MRFFLKYCSQDWFKQQIFLPNQMNWNDHKILLGVMKWIQRLKACWAFMIAKSMSKFLELERTHYILLHHYSYYLSAPTINSEDKIVWVIYFDLLILRATILNWWFRSHVCLRRPSSCIVMTCMLLGRFDLIFQFTYLPPSYFEQNPKNCRTTSFFFIFCASRRFVKGANFCVGGQLLGGAPSFWHS